MVAPVAYRFAHGVEHRQTQMRGAALARRRRPFARTASNRSARGVPLPGEFSQITWYLY